MSSSIEIGSYTLEHDREWRAWRRLDWPQDLPFHASDEWRCGPDKWEPLGAVTSMGNVFDYRRPVPLPSEDELLAALETRDHWYRVLYEGEWIKATRDAALSWLRTLLPGYEEALVKVTHVAAPAALIRAGQELTARLAQEQPSPVPADGWRPIETAPKDGTRVLVFRPKDLQAVAWYDKPFGGWFIGRDLYVPNLTHWQPLPPPPQEKGGEA